MKRIVIIGGTGFFGTVVAGHLRTLGYTPLLAGRHGGDIHLDAEDNAALRRHLRAGDIVVDLAGPFVLRSTTLVDTAIETGFHVIDLADSLSYLQAVAALKNRIAHAGIAVLPACSTHSAVSAALMAVSGIASPKRVSSLLCPASRETASPTLFRALMAFVGRPVYVLQEGRLTEALGWRSTHRFSLPDRTGYLIGTTDVWALPLAYSQLQEVSAWADANVLGGNRALGWAAAAKQTARAGLVDELLTRGLPLARLIGRRSGGFAVEVEGHNGEIARCSLSASRQAYLMAIAPAVLAISALAEGTFPHRGLVAPHLQVQPDALLAYLTSHGVRFQAEGSG